MKIMSLIAVAIVGGFSTTAPGQSTLLTTPELKALLIGSTMERGDPPGLYPRVDSPEQFKSDGTYVRFDDNYQAYGKYSIRKNEVCVQAEQEERLCRYVILDNNGNYWIRDAKSRSGYRLVKFSKIGQK